MSSQGCVPKISETAAFIWFGETVQDAAHIKGGFDKTRAGEKIKWRMEQNWSASEYSLMNLTKNWFAFFFFYINLRAQIARATTQVTSDRFYTFSKASVWL